MIAISALSLLSKRSRNRIFSAIAFASFAALFGHVFSMPWFVTLIAVVLFSGVGLLHALTSSFLTLSVWSFLLYGFFHVPPTVRTFRELTNIVFSSKTFENSFIYATDQIIPFTFLGIAFIVILILLFIPKGKDGYLKTSDFEEHDELRPSKYGNQEPRSNQ
jgi:hypothetical protein